MQLTAEFSLYPLQEEYIPVIRDFIDALHQHGDLKIVTNAMSTQVCGDFDRVFAIVRQELKASHERHGKQILVCKFIPGELDIR
ncbi:YkoF family thiamine/hydroxymethylpyrimidine-binding protein [Parahaliea mediterranea]|uniref:Thiamine-binding protein n=1 Tax=Parahaliea mediterranea TaxID=651086 RepID=A0A939DC93_9GAMM|nr:YkoF family thiamine/hydroxymethylpyrimidine-binding protein [Parahaliea mediterranea]MBN7795415.1 thiamine-binding protein [Parahaliea mediterranea]